MKSKNSAYQLDQLVGDLYVRLADVEREDLRLLQNAALCVETLRRLSLMWRDVSDDAANLIDRTSELVVTQGEEADIDRHRLVSLVGARFGLFGRLDALRDWSNVPPEEGLRLPVLRRAVEAIDALDEQYDHVLEGYEKPFGPNDDEL